MLQLLERAIALLGQILGLAQIIRDLLGDVSREHLPYQTATNTTNTQLAVQHPTYGLSAIHSDLAALATALADVPTNVNTLIASLNLLSSQVGSPVQTTSAPSWYDGPASADDIADAVWAFNLSTWNAVNGAYLLDAGECLGGSYAHAAALVGLQGVKHIANPYFALVLGQGDALQSGFDWWSFDSAFTPPVPTWTDVQAGESVYAYLHRVYSSEPFSTTGPGSVGTTSGVVWWNRYIAGGLVKWRCRVSDAQLAELYATLHPNTVDPPPPPTITFPALAPVWPGDTLVTLGTPVAFTGNVDVTATMDGVLVAITTPPIKTGHYLLGTEDLWYGVGRISFESDDGDIEPWQYLAFNSGLFTPRSMAHAAKVHLQVLGGAEGTVTPWTVTP